MKKQDFIDAYVYLLAGCAELNKHGEIQWQDQINLICGGHIYLSFPEQKPERARVSIYYDDECLIKSCLEEYDNFECVRVIGWWKDGTERFEDVLVDGEWKQYR